MTQSSVSRSPDAPDAEACIRSARSSRFSFSSSLLLNFVHGALRPLSLRTLILIELKVFFLFLFTKKNACHDLMNTTLCCAFP